MSEFSTPRILMFFGLVSILGFGGFYLPMAAHHRSSQQGFTLIELLVVVAIIGILAAIAIPQFSAYKVRSLNTRAQSDLKNAITAQEAFFVNNEVYASCSFNTTPCSSVLPGFKNSADVLLFVLETSAMTTDPAPGGAYAAVACHTRGDQMYQFATQELGGVTLNPGAIESHSTSNCLSQISSLP